MKISIKKIIKSSVVLASILLCSLKVSAEDVPTSPLLDIKEGVHYEVLQTPLKKPFFNGTVLTEFFWFGCPHCQNFESHVKDWKERLSKENLTMVSKIAVPGGERWNMDSKVYYTLRELGGTDQNVSEVLGFYQRIGQSQKRYPNQSEVFNFIESLGFDRDKIESVYNNDELMLSKLTVAAEEFDKLGSGGVPVFVVNGVYKVKFDTISSFEDAFQIIRALSHKK